MRRLFLLLMIICFAISFTSQINAEKLTTNEAYRIGINDVLEINVLDHAGLRTLATVAIDGTITFPYIGTVMVKNLKISEIEEEITRRLSEGYIKYPEVIVSLVKSMSRKIYTFGELNRRGEVAFEDNMTVIKALSLVGGTSNDGLFGRLIIRRKITDKSKEYKELLKTELNKGIIESQEVEDTLLMPDDILIVERNKTFLIEGEVIQRGRFVLEKDMTVLRALLQAGGVSKDGRYGKIKVRRKQEGKSGGYKNIAESKINDGVIEDSDVEDMILQPDDVLIVERNKTFLIQGEVSGRGRIVLEKGMTVLRALLEAGGVTENGRYGKIRLRRKEESDTGKYKDIIESELNDGVVERKEVEDMLLQPDDVLIVERNKTFLIQGEIPGRGRIVLEKEMTVLRALLQAGGVTENGRYGKIRLRRKHESGEYKDVIEAELNDGVIEDSEVEDMLLQPDDVLIVERNNTFIIYGEVQRTGEYVLQTDMTVFKAITIAGGFTKWGSGSRVKILRQKNNLSGIETIKVNINDVLDGDATADIDLKPRDVIVVSSGIF